MLSIRPTTSVRRLLRLLGLLEVVVLLLVGLKLEEDSGKERAKENWQLKVRDSKLP